MSRSKKIKEKERRSKFQSQQPPHHKPPPLNFVLNRPVSGELTWANFWPIEAKVDVDPKIDNVHSFPMQSNAKKYKTTMQCLEMVTVWCKNCLKMARLLFPEQKLDGTLTSLKMEILSWMRCFAQEMLIIRKLSVCHFRHLQNSCSPQPLFSHHWLTAFLSRFTNCHFLSIVSKHTV